MRCVQARKDNVKTQREPHLLNINLDLSVPGISDLIEAILPRLPNLGYVPSLILIWRDPSWGAFILKSMMCLLPCLLCQAIWVIDILAEVKIVCQTNCVPDTKMTSWLAGLTWSFSGGIWECGIHLVHLVTSDMPGTPPKIWHEAETVAPMSIIWIQLIFLDHCARCFLKR